MITKRMIQDGIRANLVEFVADPNMGGGTVCKIGSGWFYFGGLVGEELSPRQYLARVPKEDIIQEVFEVLEEFREDEEFKDEYDYYEAVLTYRNDQ